MSVAIVRLAAPLLAGVLLLSVAPAVSAVYPGPFDLPTLARAETDLATFVNDQRVAQGLVGFQNDAAATAIAQHRAATLAAMDVLSHTGPDGQTVFDAINAAGIPWLGAGEVLVWNTYPTETDSTGEAVSAWLASPTHASIILSRDYNYAGFGAAVSPVTGRRYYTGVLLKQPDRTGAWTKLGKASVQVVDGTKARVTLRWSGSDTPLQVLTAGLRDFEVQQGAAGSLWRSLGWTTRTATSVLLARGKVYEFRVRARDKAGNRGAWSQLSVRT